jgi:gliding motility-associated-like protein
MKFSKILFILGIALCTKSFAQTIPVVEIDSVSVLDEQRVQIAWKASTDSRVDGYYIYRVYNNNLDEPDFYDPILVNANGRLTNSYVYIDNTGTIDLTNSKVMRFYVSAVDLDVNPPIQSNLDSLATKPHQTILLNNSIDVCNASANLTWNTYVNSNNGWASGISRYEVWESENSNAYKIIYSGTRTSFVRRNLQTGVNYQYKIRVVSSDLQKTSSSNVRMTSGVFNNYPSYVYLYNASVNSDNRKIGLSWTTDTTLMKLTYEIQLSTDSVNFVTVARLDSVPYKRFRDTIISNVIPDRLNYFFRIITSCSCPDTLDTTAVTKVIRLKAKYIDPMTNLLTWNDYEGWLQGTGYYELFRVKIDVATNTQTKDLIATLVPPDTEFEDNSIDLLGADGVTSYYLQAREQVGNPIIPVTPTSFSNFAYVYKEVKLIVPDVFTPNGLNPIFRPQVLTQTTAKFNMKIYNRWGKLVFVTDDEFLGWDGRDKDNNSICLPGAYIYIIDVVDANGATLNKVGTLGLLD